MRESRPTPPEARPENKESPQAPLAKPDADSTVTPEKDEVKETYDLSKAVDNPMIKKYEPKFLAKGGEHIIYEIPGKPDIVVKVEASVMARIQKYNAEHGLPLDAMDPEVLPYAQEIVKNSQERYRRMTEHFGREHVLGLKQALVKVPVTEKIIGALHPGEPPAGAKEAKESWAIVRVQKKAEEFADPERMSVVAGYAEFKKPEKEPYDRVTRALAEGDEKAKFMPEEFRKLVPREFADLLEKAEKDPALAETLKDFVEKTMDYSDETGEILDLAGKDNVTVYQKDGKWNFRLVDALYPTGTNLKGSSMLESARASVGKAAKGETIDEGEKNVVLNTLNFVRAINGMARQLGVPRQVRLVADADRGRIDFLSLLKISDKKT